MFPATLFDYNGVLVDDEAVHLAAFREVLAPMGVTIDEARYWDHYIGFDDFHGFRAMLVDAGRDATDASVRTLVEAKKPVYLARAETALEAFPGAADALRRLSASGPVVVVSGALRSEIVLGLEMLGVTDAVAAIIAAEDTTHSKPHPEGYQLGIAALERVLDSTAARRALVIEDSTAGVRAAKAAGLVCAAVGHSYGGEDLLDAGADLVVENIAALTDETLQALYARVHG